LIFVALNAGKKWWKSFRTAYIREEVARKEEGDCEEDDEESSSKRKGYQYYDILKFLKPYVKGDTGNDYTDSCKTRSRKRKTQGDGGGDDEDLDRYFMLSMLVELKKVSYGFIYFN